MDEKESPDAIFSGNSFTNAPTPNTKTKHVYIQVKRLGEHIVYEHETIIYVMLSRLNRTKWVKYLTLKKRLVATFTVINAIGIVMLGIIQTSMIVTLGVFNIDFCITYIFFYSL